VPDEAIEKTVGDHPDVVLMDLSMPGVRDYAQNLRSFQHFSHVPHVRVVPLPRTLNNYQSMPLSRQAAMLPPKADRSIRSGSGFEAISSRLMNTQDGIT
jgi:DNA-binding NarL/FixJ family response regulator